MRDELFAAGCVCEADLDSGDTMNKKIRNAQLAQFNFILGRQSGLLVSDGNGN